VYTQANLLLRGLYCVQTPALGSKAYSNMGIEANSAEIYRPLPPLSPLVIIFH